MQNGLRSKREGRQVIKVRMVTHRMKHRRQAKGQEADMNASAR
jgi:hypothetical protein